jgi:predicted NAD/FAD-binding protein
MPHQLKRIAVVGSGISGLSAAWLLSKGNEVVLYEADNRLGGHSNTVMADVEGKAIPVDTGFIVYNEPTYPNLTALFDHLKVKTLKSDMSFGVSLDEGRFEYSSNSLASYFKDPSTLLNPRFWSVVREVVRFYQTAPAAMRRLADEGLSLGEFLDRCGYGEAFQKDHLLPQAAAIWSCTIHEIRDYPAASFLAFCDSHGLMRFSSRPSWRTVAGGSKTYVAAIENDFSGEVRLNAGVTAIRRVGGPNGKMVEIKDVSGAVDRFDDVVLASHANQSLKMLTDATEEEVAVLGSFRYTRNIASLHADTRMMPSKRTWWSSWNYLGHTGDHSEATVTYWMNKLQDLPIKGDLFVTLNPPSSLALKGEIRREEYDHPMFDGAAMDAQKQIWGLQGQHNTWFCGAYLGAGFHEDGLQAGLAVAESLGGIKRPWRVGGESGRIALPSTQILTPKREPIAA